MKWHSQRHSSKAIMTSNAQHGPEKIDQIAKQCFCFFTKRAGRKCLGTNFIPRNWKHIQYSVRQTFAYLHRENSTCLYGSQPFNPRYKFQKNTVYIPFKCVFYINKFNMYIKKKSMQSSN